VDVSNYQLSINNCQLPEGYKQTEVGVIPEDWEIKPLGDFISLQRGYDLTVRERRPGNIPVMGAAGQNGFHSEALVEGPGIVLGRSGASYGQVHYCESDYWPHNTGLYATDLHGNDPLFTFYFLDSLDFSRYNSGGAQQSLNRNFIYPILIAVPDVKEQRAIATALSDVDALIAALDKLIAKKRHLKTATMQQLLTGKKRLPGNPVMFGPSIDNYQLPKGYKQTEVGVIPEDWEVKQLGAIGAKFLNGGTPSTKNVEYWSGEIPWITGADIVGQEVTEIRRFITSDAIKNSATNLVEKGNLLIVTRTGVGKIAIAPFDVAISQDLTGVYLDADQASTSFIFSYFEYYSDALRSLNQGTSIAGITREVLISAEVILPSVEEQRAIATVLSDMDSEIAAIEARRAKTQAIKQGMMQQLLTGKVRLVASA
jgi:type I restriction enzyme S subunit